MDIYTMESPFKRMDTSKLRSEWELRVGRLRISDQEKEYITNYFSCQLISVECFEISKNDELNFYAGETKISVGILIDLRNKCLNPLFSVPLKKRHRSLYIPRIPDLYRDGEIVVDEKVVDYLDPQPVPKTKPKRKPKPKPKPVPVQVKINHEVEARRNVPLTRLKKKEGGKRKLRRTASRVQRSKPKVIESVNGLNFDSDSGTEYKDADYEEEFSGRILDEFEGPPMKKPVRMFDTVRANVASFFLTHNDHLEHTREEVVNWLQSKSVMGKKVSPRYVGKLLRKMRDAGLLTHRAEQNVYVLRRHHRGRKKNDVVQRIMQYIGKSATPASPLEIDEGDMQEMVLPDDVPYQKLLPVITKYVKEVSEKGDVYVFSQDAADFTNKTLDSNISSRRAGMVLASIVRNGQEGKKSAVKLSKVCKGKYKIEGKRKKKRGGRKTTHVKRKRKIAKKEVEFENKWKRQKVIHTRSKSKKK